MNYFHGNIGAETAQRRLLSLKSDNEGRFLVRQNRGVYIISFVKDQAKRLVSHIKVPRQRNHNLFVSKPHLLNSSVEAIVNFIAAHMEAKLIHPVLIADIDEDDGEEEDQDGGESLTVCHVCDKQVYSSPRHMDAHYITFCQVCEKIILKYRWVGHKTACYPNMKIHQCPHCDYRTSKHIYFKRHISRHPGGDTNSCDKCEKSFISVFRLEKHIAQDHNNGKWYCKWCPKKFSSRRTCAFHTKSCSGNPDRILKNYSGDDNDEELMQLVSAPALIGNGDSSPMSSITLQDEVKANESDPRVVTLEEIMKLSIEGRWNDVTIICEDGKIQSNSFLLTSMFPVIREIFNNFTNEEDFFISMPDISINDMDMFFKSIYKKQSLLKIDARLSDLLSSELQHLGTVQEIINDQYQNDHDYAGDDKSEPDLVKIKFVKEHSYNINKKAKKRKPCEICGKLVRFRSSRSHCDSCGHIKVPCEICGRKLASKRMKGHMRFHDSEEGRRRLQKQCSGQCGDAECRKIFRAPYELNRHIKSKTSGPQPCHLCGKLCKKMDEHIKNYHDSSRSKCNICGKALLIEKLEDHQKSCEKLVIVCNICGVTFSSHGNFKYHWEKLHQVQEAEYKCNKCGKLLRTKIDLKRHMRSHDEKIPCPECGVKVRNLKYHMKQAHTPDDQQPQQCQDCGKGFIDMGHLKKHRMNVHLKLRPYNCRYGCDIAYNDTSNRNQHEKKTHGKLFTTEKEEKEKKRLMGIVDA